MASSNITLSAGVRQNLLSLQNTAQLMSQTQNRLATGKKVNSALDNATNFFTAQSLQSRASDMAALLDNMTSGIKTLEAADNGLSAITKTVESMQSTLRQARQDKSFKTESYTVNVGATPAGTEQMSFSGGSVGSTAVNVALTTSDVAATAGTVVGGALTLGSGISFADAPAAGASITSGAFVSTLTFDDAGDELEIVFDVGGATETITIDAAAVDAALGGGANTITSAGELATVINDQAAGFTATANADGTLTFTTTATGQAATLEITSVTATDNGGADTLTNTSGIAVAAEETGTDATPRELSFDIEVDGSGTTTTITIDEAAVQAAGNSDNVIDSLEELVEIIGDQLPAGVTVAAGTGDNAGRLVFTSDSTGATSSVEISNVSATGITAANLGIVASTGTSGTDETFRARTVDELVTAINGTTDLRGFVRASNDNGRLRIENISTSALTVGGLNADGELSGGVSNGEIGGNTVRTNLVKQFNELRDQLNKLADDASYNGVNLLRGDLLKLTFNETGTSTIEIQAKDEAGVERAINSGTLGISTAENSDFDTDSGIDALLDELSGALGVLRSQSSSFGSNLSIVENRTQFTKAMINTLQTGADSLVLADTNEEAANLLALQTRQQLSSTALSLASQADQAVLRLF